MVEEGYCATYHVGEAIFLDIYLDQETKEYDAWMYEAGKHGKKLVYSSAEVFLTIEDFVQEVKVLIKCM